MGLYELSNKRAKWEVEAVKPGPLSTGAVISPTGTYFAIDEQAPPNLARYFVYRTNDGVAAGAPIESKGSAQVEAENPLAISDDGKTLVTVDRLKGHIYDVPHGRKLAEFDGIFFGAAFRPGTSLLALAGSDRVRIIERRGDDLVSIAELPGRGFGTWSAEGLAIVTRTGIDVWTGQSARHALDVSIQYDPSGGEDTSSFIAFSPDGHYFANESKQGLSVYDLRAGSVLFTRSELKGIGGLAFRGSVARVIWSEENEQATYSRCSDLELPSGRTLSTRDLGKRVSWNKKSFLNAHAGPEGHFRVALSPSGDFVDLESLHAEREHDVKAL